MSPDEQLIKYGEPLPYDKNFKGPLSRRSCTDVLFLLLFIIFLAGWGFVAFYAIKNGDLNQLLVPIDSQNNRCGVDSPVKNKKYLFFFDLIKCIDPIVPITGCQTPQVCVEKCPDETFIFDTYIKTNPSVYDLKNKMYCTDEKEKNSITSIPDAQRKVDELKCARWYLKSKPILNRCIWDFSSTSCEYIPSYIFERKRRDATDDDVIGFNKSRRSTESSPHGMLFPYVPLPESYLSLMETTSGSKPSHWEGAGLTALDQRKPADEPILQCETRKKLGQEIIMEKVRRINTYLARFVGNLVGHFSSRADAQKLGQLVVEDILVSGWTIFTSLFIAMAVSLLFIVIMRWVAAPVIWISIVGVHAIMIYGLYFCISTYLSMEDPAKSAVQPNLKAVVQSIFEKKNTWLYISIALGVLLLIIFLIVLFLRKRIVIAIALVKEGSKAVSSVISSVFFPLFPWALQIATIIFAVCVGLYLASVGSPTYKILGNVDGCMCRDEAKDYKNLSICTPDIFNAHCNPSCTTAGCYFDKIDSPKMVAYFHAINVIGFFWLMFFISGFGDMVLAATFATWYWTFHKSDVPYFTLTRAFYRTVRYHLGTLAFGSLIITICRLIRLVLEYIDSKLKGYDNPFTKAILCCCKCFFWCLERFLRFLNRNAYIMCAIHGKNFCTSAKDAFNLLMRNFLRVIALDKVTDFLFFLAKLLITLAMGAAVYFYFDKDFAKLEVHYKWVPTIIVMIGTFLIATVFFGVYSTAVDTLFLCFLEDSERNDGSAEKPYYMSKQLMKILGKRNKIPKREYR